MAISRRDTQGAAAHEEDLSLRAEIVGNVLLFSMMCAAGSLALYYWAKWFASFGGPVVIGGIPVLPGNAVLCGVAVGVCIGILRVAWNRSRRRMMKQVAGILGFSRSDTAGETMEHGLAELFDASVRKLENVYVLKEPEGLLALGDLHWVQGGLLSGDDGFEGRLHVVYFESAELDLPRFYLRPESRIAHLVSETIKVTDIDFDSHPEFSSRYHLSAVGRNDELLDVLRGGRTRALFNEAVRDYFGRTPGMWVVGRGTRLAVYRSRKLVDSVEELVAFVRQALSTVALFRKEAPKEAAARAEHEAAVGLDPTEAAAELPGKLGAAIRRSLVTQEDVAKFLVRDPPRAIPANIWQHARLPLGCVLLLAGIWFSTGGIFALLTGAPFFVWLVCMSVGLPLVFYPLRHHVRMRRVLRHGVLANGVIEKLQGTSVVAGDGRVYRVSICFQCGGSPRRLIVKIHRKAIVERARLLAGTGQTVQVLYDRKCPDNAVCADLLVTFDPRPI